MTPSFPLLALATASGLALGSFAVTGGLRAASGDSALSGRSRCDGCGVRLSFWQTTPLFSYIRARGACTACAAPIDRWHPAGELLGAAVCLTALLVAPLPRALALAALGLVLLAASTVDWKVKRLPDVLTAAVAAIGAGLALAQSAGALVTGLASAMLSMALLQAVRLASRRRRGDPGLGLGDVKLVGALALWTGAATPWMVLAAALAGLAMMALLRPADGRLPFGPAIALGAWIVGLGGEAGLWPTTA